MSNFNTWKYRLLLTLDEGLEATNIIKGASVTGNTFVIEDLQIVAKISKTVPKRGSSPDNTSISIYNLDNETRSAIMNKDINNVILEAGYKEDTILPQLYSGSIIKATESWNGTDIVTELICSSNVFRKREAIIENTFTKGTPLVKILKELVDSFGLPSYMDLGINTSYAITTDLPLSGLVSVKLDKLCKTYGLRWFIDNDTTVIIPVGTGNSRIDKNLTLYPHNILDYLSREVHYVIKTTKKGKALAGQDTGLSIKTFLTNLAAVGGYVTLTGFDPLKYPNHNGTHSINEVQHDLDYRGNSWHTTITTGEI